MSSQTNSEESKRIGGVSDIALDTYLELTADCALPGQKLALRKRLGIFRRQLQDSLATYREMFAEAVFFWRCARLSEKVPSKVALSMLRKRAHVLEKNLMKLHPQPDHAMNTEMVRQARGLLLQVKGTPEATTDNTLPWILRLLKEYEWNRKLQWTCDKMFIPKEKESKARELLSIMKRRRSVRFYQDRPVPEDLLRQVIEAATLAPSSCNRQAWQFLIVTKQEDKDVVMRSASGGRPWAGKAPHLILTLMDGRFFRVIDDRFTMFQDAAIANQNMMLMADALGLGACWVSLNSFSNESGIEDLRRTFQIPSYMAFAGVIALGYPAQWVCPIVKLSPENVMHMDRFRG